MTRKKDVTPKKLLTDPELELMQALWDIGAGTVRDVVNRLPKDRWAYTTVATVFKVLEKKGIVTSQKDDRAHTYFPVISREAYEEKTVQHLVKKVFRGEASQFAMKLLQETKLSADELASLRALLNKGSRP